MTGARWTEDQHQEFLNRKQQARVQRRTPKKPRQRPEEELQKQVADFLDRALLPDYRWFHTPNERGGRSKVENMILKTCGVKAGVFDVIILCPDLRFVPIELKSKDGRLSKDQKEWRDWALSIGAPWACCRSLDDVVAALDDAGVPLRMRPA